MNINSAMTTRIGLCGEDADFDQDIYIYIYIYTHCCLPLLKCPPLYNMIMHMYIYIHIIMLYIYIHTYCHVPCHVPWQMLARYVFLYPPPYVHASLLPSPNLMISLANNETMHLCYQNYVLNPFFFSFKYTDFQKFISKGKILVGFPLDYTWK